MSQLIMTKVSTAKFANKVNKLVKETSNLGIIKGLLTLLEPSEQANAHQPVERAEVIRLLTHALEAIEDDKDVAASAAFVLYSEKLSELNEA